MKSLVFLLSMLASAYSLQAKAEGYFGLQGGVGEASGTAVPLNAGFAYGATAGYQVLPNFGLGLTVQHDSLAISNNTSFGSGAESITQILAEANMFSFLLLHGGIHIGDVITNLRGIASTDLGFGIHLGFDIQILDKISVGLSASGTYVTQANDKHSLINLVVPLKIWF